MENNIKTVKLPDGSEMPKLGQGTWQMAEDDAKMEREIAGLRHGIERGIRMIDTAEMYAEGKAESLAGDAIKGLDRSELYIVSKVYPQNANKKHMFSSLERSLKLLGTDYLDMYLLHWREEADMEDLWKVPDGHRCVMNQVLYNLGTRGIEYDLIPWQREHGVPFTAYSPVGQAGALVTQDGVSKAQMMSDKNVNEVAARLGVSVVQLLLAFSMRFDDFASIPKAVGFDHIDENAAALDIALSDADIEQLSASFPAPLKKIDIEKY